MEMRNKRFAGLKQERSHYEDHWREVADAILPRRGRFLQTGNARKGRQLNRTIYDSTATTAHRTISAGMMSGITSPARPWFRLRSGHAEFREDGAVKDWLFEAESLMREIFQASNVYNALANFYEEISLFGTAVMLVVEDFDDVIRAHCYTAGEYYLANGPRGDADTLYREFEMTVAQIVDEFGIENVSDRVKSAYRRSALDERIDVVHVIEPNRDRDVVRAEAAEMPYRSDFWEKASDETWLRQSGFQEKPFMAARWHLGSGEIYGRSPGMDALPDVRQLQVQQKRKGQAIDKQVDPPMVAPNSLRNQHATLLPGGITYMPDGAAGQGFQPAYQVNLNLNDLTRDIFETQDRIRSTFYADLFLMMANSDRRQITAREIDERHEEKMLMLGPVLERLQDELLGPLIRRTMAIMSEAGILAPPPDGVDPLGLDVDYISILAQAQKAVATTSIERTLGFVGNIAGIVPEALDKIDADQAIDEYAGLVGTPPRIIRSDDRVQEIRAERAEAQQAQQMAAAVPQGAETARLLSETDTRSPSALTDMLGL